MSIIYPEKFNRGKKTIVIVIFLHSNVNENEVIKLKNKSDFNNVHSYFVKSASLVLEATFFLFLWTTFFD